MEESYITLMVALPMLLVFGKSFVGNTKPVTISNIVSKVIRLGHVNASGSIVINPVLRGCRLTK